MRERAGGRGCILSLTQLHFSLLVVYTSASDCHSSSGLLRNRNQMDKYLSFPPDPPPSFGSPPYLLTFVNCTFRPAHLPDLLSSLIFIICYAIPHSTDRYRHFEYFFFYTFAILPWPWSSIKCGLYVLPLCREYHMYE